MGAAKAPVGHTLLAALFPLSRSYPVIPFDSPTMEMKKSCSFSGWRAGGTTSTQSSKTKLLLYDFGL